MITTMNAEPAEPAEDVTLRSDPRVFTTEALSHGGPERTLEVRTRRPPLIASAGRPAVPAEGDALAALCLGVSVVEF